MQFLGVGWQEILLIMVLMLVVVGPERMPGVAYQIGRAVKTLQSYARAVRSEFGDEISYIEEQYKTVRGEIDEARTSLRDEQTKFAAEMREATSSIEEEMQTFTAEANAAITAIETMPDNRPATPVPVAAGLFAPSEDTAGALQAPPTPPTEPPAPKPPLLF